MPSLAVFLSDGRGLWNWDRVGSLSRELALYKKFVESGWDVSFYTYDRTPRVPEIGFAANVYPQWPYLIPRQMHRLYHTLLPFRFYRKGRKSDVILTNQAHSGEGAMSAGKLWNTSLVARCGYVYGEAAETLRLSGRSVRKKIDREKTVFATSELCIVSTKELKEWICIHYDIRDSKVAIIPNYVDTALFVPDESVKPHFDIIFAGRLSQTKRPLLLLEALADTDASIHMIGDGELKATLARFTSKSQNHVQFTPRVTHETLPRFFNAAKIYVNVSEWEGHPKSMIEAMACGLACIGTNSPGINNLLIHEETGMLVDPEPRKIREAVLRLLDDTELRTRLGKNAREYAVQHFSLDVIFPAYKSVLDRFLDV